jgi:hypothetical protein
MPWVRFDDQFTIHRKVNGLTDAAFRLHVDAIFWCARNLTDGRIGHDELVQVSRVRSIKKHVTALVSRGLWVEFADGWLIHDYLDFQFSKERVLADRESNARRQKRFRGRHKDDEPTTRNAVTDAVSNGSRNSAPSRPDPKGRDGGSVVDKPSLRIARVDDDPNQKIDTRIVDLLREHAGANVSLEWAAKVRHQLLDGRDINNPSAYVAKAIRTEPSNYVPAAGRDPSSRSVDEAIRAARGDS